MKRCVGLHSYFASSGPWRHCWVRFGYDPSKYKGNYRYKVIEMRSKKASFQVFQKPSIKAEVCKNENWYLHDECDPIDGFISKALKNFIVYTIDNVDAREIDKKIEETLDSDFEMLDM